MIQVYGKTTKMKHKIKTIKPMYAQCYKCAIKYDLTRFGTSCPICRNKEKHDK